MLEHLESRVLLSSAVAAPPMAALTAVAAASVTVSNGIATHHLTDAMGREYYLYTPATIDASKTYWLVVGVHGYGGTGAGAAGMSSYVKKGCIVLGPSFPNEGYQYLEQNAGKQLADLIAALGARYRLHSRAFLYGFSGGSQFAHRFAMAYPDLVGGVSAHSGGTWATGGIWDSINTSATDIPFVISCGLNDTVMADSSMPYNRLDWCRQFEAQLNADGFIYRAEYWPNTAHAKNAGVDALTAECFTVTTTVMPKIWAGTAKLAQLLSSGRHADAVTYARQQWSAIPTTGQSTLAQRAWASYRRTLKPLIPVTSASVPENQEPAVVLNRIMPNWAEPSVFTYSLAPLSAAPDNANFVVDPDTGELQASVSFNYEAKKTYRLLIVVSDAGEGSFTLPLTVNVSNVNERPASVKISASRVAEHKPAGTVVGTLSASDPDLGNTFTYSLRDGSGTLLSPDNAAFKLVRVGTTIQLRTNASLNYETRSTRTVIIRAKDQGGLFCDKTITISVTNVNERPRSISLTPAAVLEHQPAGTGVGLLSTTDPDLGNRFTYTLVSGTGASDNSAFTIVGNQLRARRSFNYESKKSYSIRVRSTDQGRFYIEKVLIISVLNVNEQLV